MDKVVQEYIERAERAITVSRNGFSKLTPVQFDVIGMASGMNRCLLNNLVDQNTRYLEIGTWFGSTFIAACYGNDPEYACAIDNFSEFAGNEDTPEPLEALKTPSGELLIPTTETFTNNCIRCGVTNFDFINADCFNLMPAAKSRIHDISVYFYDGGHSEEDQRKAISYYVGNLANVFILIVDDYNLDSAQVGTKIGLLENNILVHKDWELFTPHKENRSERSWWNGIYVAVCEKMPFATQLEMDI